MHAFTLAAVGSAGLLNFLQALEIGITQGAIYALVALGYTMVYGIIELINFAHGDVFGWGVGATFLLVSSLGITKALTGLQLVGTLALLIVVASVFCGVLNVAIERLAYRPLRRAPRLAPLIAAVAVSFILEQVMQLWPKIGPYQYSFPVLFPTTNFINVSGIFTVQYRDIVIVVLSLVVMLGLSQFIRVTKLGRAMRATAQDPEAAQLMGVNINRTISITFLIGGALAGAAAVIFAISAGGYLIFTMGFRFGLFAFTAAVLGGIGNVNGAVLGGFLIGIAEALSNTYLPDGTLLNAAVIFGILVLILVVRPSGLLGARVPDKA